MFVLIGVVVSVLGMMSTIFSIIDGFKKISRLSKKKRKIWITTSILVFLIGSVYSFYNISYEHYTKTTMNQNNNSINNQITLYSYPSTENLSAINGTIDNLFESIKSIQISSQDSGYDSQVFALSPNTIININSEKSTYDDLEIGMQFICLIRNSEIIEINAFNNYYVPSPLESEDDFSILMYSIEDKKPIVNALVSITNMDTNENFESISGVDGIAKFDKVTKRNYSIISIKCDGYVSRSGNINMSEGIKSVLFFLQPTGFDMLVVNMHNEIIGKSQIYIYNNQHELIISDITDENGFYSKKLPKGTYYVTVEQTGYTKRNEEIYISEDAGWFYTQVGLRKIGSFQKAVVESKVKKAVE